jgi:erythromycin esterase-like protein
VLALLLDSLRRCDLVPAAGEAGERFAAEVLQRVVDGTGAGGRRRKAVLLPHNGHVARARVGRGQQDILGQYLVSWLGAGYRAVGVVLGAGSFNGSLFDPKSGYAPGRRTLQLDAVRPGSLESVLDSGGASYLLPVHPSAGSPWPGPARLMRDIGASYAPSYAEHYWSPLRLQSTYDAVVYVPRVQPLVERPWRR